MTSIYIHIPFCSQKCFYCSFSVVVGRGAHADRYIDCVIKEIEGGRHENIFSVYWGGGTPSTLNPDQITRLDRSVMQQLNNAGIKEKTIELNPEDVDKDKARLIKDLHFTRVSLGIQSFHEGHLMYLGRGHNHKQALAAFDILRNAGHDNINIDLIYGLPQQSLEDIKKDLNMIKALSPEHVSLYSLTIDEFSRFYVKKVQPLGGDEQISHYVWAIDFLRDLGIEQYEISNFSRLGKESMHNMHYWNGGNYHGIGMAAHSHTDGRRSWNVARIKDYMTRIEQGKEATLSFEVLSPEQRLMERIVFGLRLNRGVDIEQVQEECGYDIPKERWDQIGEFVAHGFLSYEQPFLKTTPQGCLILDEISSYLI